MNKDVGSILGDGEVRRGGRDKAEGGCELLLSLISCVSQHSDWNGGSGLILGHCELEVREGNVVQASCRKRGRTTIELKRRRQRRTRWRKERQK